MTNPATEITVKNLINQAINAANLVAYRKDDEVLFGNITIVNPYSGSSISKFRLMHTIGGIPAQIVEDKDGEKLLDDAFHNVEAFGMKLVIIVGSKSKIY